MKDSFPRLFGRVMLRMFFGEPYASAIIDVVKWKRK